MNHVRRHRFGWFVATLMVALFSVSMNNAHAQLGGAGYGGNYSCVDGVASGSVYNSDMVCPASLNFDNIFTFIVCNMEQLSSDLMGSMYCGMVTELWPMVMAVLTLAVLFFGIAFTIGVIPATAREFQKFLIKVAFITVFATQAEYMIDIAYNFLVGGAREGIAVAMSGLYTAPDGYNNVSGIDMYYELDHFLGQAIKFATDYVGASAADKSDMCKNAVFAVMAVMAVAFPPVFYLGLLIVVGVAMTFLRAVFGYIYAIVGIAFLLTLSPIFLSFSLFTQTRQFFDKWLGYLVSFALQMVLVFAFLSFVVSIDVRNISGSLVDVIMPVAEQPETTALRMPWEYCTVCEFKVVDENGAEIPESDYGKFIGKGKLKCNEPKKPITVLHSTQPNDPNKEAFDNVLLKFATTGLLSLLILAYVVNYVLALIPQLAQLLAGGMGGSYAPQLGGGQNIRGIVTMDLPGESMIQSFGDGFQQGFTREGGGNSVSATVEGVKSGLKMMISGTDSTDSRARDRDPGLMGSFTRFLINPHGDEHD